MQVSSAFRTSAAVSSVSPIDDSVAKNGISGISALSTSVRTTKLVVASALSRCAKPYGVLKSGYSTIFLSLKSYSDMSGKRGAGRLAYADGEDCQWCPLFLLCEKGGWRDRWRLAQQPHFCSERRENADSQSIKVMNPECEEGSRRHYEQHSK